MKASEFRIGNWIRARGENWQVRSVSYWEVAYELTTDSGFRWHSQSATTIKGILINEDWLMKFGFKKVKPSSFDKDDYEWIYEIGKRTNTRNFDVSVGKYTDGNLVAFLYSGDALDIQFVHQLQNLYHAIVGEELQIK